MNPPAGLPGLDPAWSRCVDVPGIDGVARRFHVLDTRPSAARLTLLCVHGNPTWSYLFRDLLASAPADVRVVAVDHLDMGFSERTGTTRRLTDRIDDLDTLVSHLALDGPVVTVAHDWGGPISLGWALRHRERLAGIVLMNTAVHQPAGSPAPAVIRLVRSRPMLRLVTTRTDVFVRGALAMADHRIPAEVRAGYLAPYRTTDRRRAIGDFVADIPLDPAHPSAAALDTIADGIRGLDDVPTLLVWGAADPVFSDRYLHDLEARLPHADVHRHPRASHLVPEDVDAFGAILDWATSIGPAIGPAIDTTIRTAGTATNTVHHRTPRTSTLVGPHRGPGERTAVVELGAGGSVAGQITFDGLEDRIDLAAQRLTALGVRPGERVAVMIPPGVGLSVAVGAVWRLGAVVVLVDAGLGPRGMSAAIRSANPAHLVGIPRALLAARTLRWPGKRIPASILAVADSSSTVLPDPPNVDDPAAIVFTSGATGPSKGVRYSHRRLEAQRDALVDLYRIVDDDRLVAAFAPFALYGPVMGITSVVPDMDVTAPGTLSAAALGDAVAAVHATVVFASPAALANVVRTADELTADHRRAMAAVRLLLSAGAPVRPTLLRRAAALFPAASVHTPYGMTECLPVADIDLAGIDAAGDGDGVCVGVPIPGVDVRIRPLDGSDPQPNGLGEIIVRAAHARDGYDRLWRTEFAATPDDGWHATGDVGHLDDRGRLWVSGRLGHVITTSAGPVAPVATEQAVERLDGIAVAALVGVGPAGDQRLVVVVEPDEPVRRPRSADTMLLRRVRDAVGDDLDVVAVLVVPHVPVDRRHNSKVDRTRLARWAESVLAGGRMTSP